MDLQELLDAAQNNQEAALKALTERFHRLVHSTVLATLMNFPDLSVRDTEQEVWTSIWKNLEQFERPHDADTELLTTAFRSWLAKIARNTALNTVKHRNAEKRNPERTVIFSDSESLASQNKQESPSATAHTNMVQEKLREAIENLDPSDKEVVRRRYYEGKTIDEISAASELSIDQVRQSLVRSRRTLRKFLPELVDE